MNMEMVLMVNWLNGNVVAFIVLGLLSGLATPSVAGSEAIFVGESNLTTIENGYIEGSFAALTLKHITGMSTNAAEFTLNANRALLEDERAPKIGPIVGESQTEAINIDSHKLTGKESRNGYSFAILANPGSAEVVIQPTCNEISQPGSKIIESERFARVDREGVEVDAGNTIEWNSCKDKTVRMTIRGEFEFSLWEWDVLLTSPDGEETTRESGVKPFNEDLSTLHLHAGEARQLWFSVRSGEINLTLLERPELYLYDAEAQTRLVTLSGGKGTLHQDGINTEVQGKQMDFHGDLSVELHNKGDSVYSKFTGRFDDIAIDGLALFFMEQRPEESSRFPFASMLLGVLAIVGSVLVFSNRHLVLAHTRTRNQYHRPTTWKEYQAEGHRQLALSYQEKGSQYKAVKRFTKALRHKPASALLQYERAESYAKMRDFEKALEDNQQVEEFLTLALKNEADPPDLLVMNAYDACQNAMMAKKPELALWWMGRVLLYDPRGVEHFEEEPIYASIRYDLRFIEHMDAAYNRLDAEAKLRDALDRFGK